MSQVAILRPVFRTETGHIIDRMLRGEPELLALFLDRARVRLVLWAGPKLSRRLRGRVEADDAVQEITVRVLEAFPGFRGRDRLAFNKWLFQIARHTLADLGKYHGAQKRQEAPREAPVPAAAAPVQRAIRRESVQRMLEALDRLAPDDQQAVSLRYLEALPYTEIAEILGVSPGAARVRVCRALANLKLAIGTEESTAGRE